MARLARGEVFDPDEVAIGNFLIAPPGAAS